MGIASSGVNQIIDVADSTVSKAIEAVSEVEDAAVATGHQAIDLGDKTFDGAVSEIVEAKDRLVGLLRNLANKITEPLP